MPNSLKQSPLDVPLRNAKATIKPRESEVRKLNPQAADVIQTARALARIEPKQMADVMGVSHSYVLRGLEAKDDLGFLKMWELPDAFWFELACLILESRGVGRVRRLFEVERLKVG
jgi:hypothetical protein